MSVRTTWGRKSSIAPTSSPYVAQAPTTSRWAAGTGAAGSAAVALVVPAALAVPFGGALADGARPALVLTAVYAVTAVAVAAAGLGAALAVPYPVVVALAAVAVTAIAFVRPCL